MIATKHIKPHEVGNYDTFTSAVFRFLTEIAAWVAGPWAAADVFDVWWASIPVALVLILLPALFNTPGDKKITGIPTPGGIRLLIEMLILVAAVYGALTVWSPWLAGIVILFGALMIITGIPRYRWLLIGALANE